MKNFFIFAILVFISLSSCRKESLIPIDETETEDPKEIEGAFFKGIVTDENGGVAGTKVEIYQHEKLVGTATTDGTGAFNTLNIPLVKDVHVTFAVRQSNNEVKAKRVRENFGKSDIGTISLTENQMFDTKHEYLQNPGSNDLIVVSGYVTDPSGNPAKADVVLLYDIVKVAASTYETQGDGVSTDENGYYEILMPKDQEFYYIVLQELCQPRLLNKDEIRIFDGAFPAELVGPFTADIQLPLLNNASPASNTTQEQSFSFVVIATTCSGTLVENGSIEGIITKGSQSFPINASLISSFIFYGKTYCISNANLNAPWLFTYKIKDFKNNKISDEMTVTLTEKDQDLGVVQVCNEVVTDKPFVQWSIGLTNYYYEITHGSIDVNGALISSTTPTNNTGQLKFTIPNYTNGGNQIKNFTFQGGLVGQALSFSQNNADIITVTYTQQDANTIKGSFEGDLTTLTSGVAVPFPVKGSFYIKLP